MNTNSNYSNMSTSTPEVNPLDAIEERIKSGSKPAVAIEQVKKDVSESLKRLDELRITVNKNPDLMGTKLLLDHMNQVEGVIRQVERLMEISNKEAEKKGMTLDEYLKS